MVINHWCVSMRILQKIAFIFFTGEQKIYYEENYSHNITISKITGTFFELAEYIYSPRAGIAYEKNAYAIYFFTCLP